MALLREPGFVSHGTADRGAEGMMAVFLEAISTSGCDRRPGPAAGHVVLYVSQPSPVPQTASEGSSATHTGD